MEFRKLTYFVLWELCIFILVGVISYLIWPANTWNFRALHFIIFQDVMFIIFSILPAMGSILENERVPVFITHWALIGIHSTNGVILIITGKGMIDQQYFVSVACLVFIGSIFTICVTIILIIAYFTGDVEAIFDEQFLNIDNSSHTHYVHRLNEDFMDDFENINSLIFKKYMNLNNKCCPICLGDYQEGDAMKILPTWYHTFHSECIDLI